MKPIIVYRLENEEGNGPFRGGNREDADLLLAHLGIGQCSSLKARVFKKLTCSRRWVCAWEKEEDFDNWIGEHKETFLGLGYSKVTYKAKQYRLLKDQVFWKYVEELEDFEKEDAEGCQVFFNKKHATKIN